MSDAPRALDLRIEELVLHGFRPEDRQRIVAALNQELTRAFAEQGIPERLLAGGDIDRLDAGSFTAAAGAAPHTIGTQLARALYRGLAR